MSPLLRRLQIPAAPVIRALRVNLDATCLPLALITLLGLLGIFPALLKLCVH